MRKKLSSRAFSLVELMVVISLMLIAGIAITNLFIATQKTFNHTDSRIKARKEASFILRTIERELRQTSQGSEDFESIELANRNKLVFYADVDNDEKPEKIAYEQNESTVSKTVIQTSNEAVPWEFNGSQSQKVLTQYIKADDPAPLFTYYQNVDQELASLPLSKSDREKVKIIRVSISILFPKSNKEDQMQTEIYLRNKNDPL